VEEDNEEEEEIVKDVTDVPVAARSTVITSFSTPRQSIQQLRSLNRTHVCNFKPHEEFALAKAWINTSESICGTECSILVSSSFQIYNIAD